MSVAAIRWRSSHPLKIAAARTRPRMTLVAYPRLVRTSTKSSSHWPSAPDRICLQMCGRTGSVSSIVSSSVPGAGTRRRPHVLCKARREVDGCNARDNGASPTVTCHNPVLVSFTCRVTLRGIPSDGWDTSLVSEIEKVCAHRTHLRKRPQGLWKTCLMSDDRSEYAVFSRRKVASLLDVSVVTLWRMVRRRAFPAPMRISPGRVGWLALTVHRWIAAQAAAAERLQSRDGAK